VETSDTSGLVYISWLYTPHSQVLIQASAPFQVDAVAETHVHVAGGRSARVATCADCSKTVQSFPGETMRRQVGWLVPAKKGHRESATTAAARVKGQDWANPQGSAANQCQNGAAIRRCFRHEGGGATE